MKTEKEVINILDTYLLGVDKESSNKIKRVRVDKLKDILSFLRNYGFPVLENDKFNLSLIPFIFQEANYDGLSWTDKNAKLGHLQFFFDIDFVVQEKGTEKNDVSVEEYKGYVNTSLGYIEKSGRQTP